MDRVMKSWDGQHFTVYDDRQAALRREQHGFVCLAAVCHVSSPKSRYIVLEKARPQHGFRACVLVKV
jgi:hypothetical protein